MADLEVWTIKRLYSALYRWGDNQSNWNKTWIAKPASHFLQNTIADDHVHLSKLYKVHIFYLQTGYPLGHKVGERSGLLQTSS